MKFGSIGTDTSPSEVTDISPFGIWLLHRGKEYFLSFENFPWFKNAPVSQIFSVVEEDEDHLRWPVLDIDLSLKSIRNPEDYPLVYEPITRYGKQKNPGNSDQS